MTRSLTSTVSNGETAKAGAPLSWRPPATLWRQLAGSMWRMVTGIGFIQMVLMNHPCLSGAFLNTASCPGCWNFPGEKALEKATSRARPVAPLLRKGRQVNPHQVSRACEPYETRSSQKGKPSGNKTAPAVRDAWANWSPTSYTTGQGEDSSGFNSSWHSWHGRW